MKDNDIISIKESLTQIVSLLEDIKATLKVQRQEKESKLPRQI
jgi:hypothetical protein